MRRLAWIAVGVAILVMILAGAVRVALQPDRVARLVLARAGTALGLEITAAGRAELVLRGTPRLVVRDLVARETGATRPLLRASRVAVAVPWTTLRTRGAVLEVQRIELDAPVLDVAALQAWRAKRPPSDARLPTLLDGLSIARGRIDGIGWRVQDIRLDVPRFAPGRPFAARARGRYADGPNRLDFDLALAMARAANGAGSAAVGTLSFARGDGSLAGRVHASGALRIGDAGTVRVSPLRLGLAARYASGQAREAFALGLRGPFRFEHGIATLAPAGVALRGAHLLPTFDARGAFALGPRLVLRLEGVLPHWNAGWPALPPPIGQSASALPFALEYAGARDLSGIASLRLRRDAAWFDGRFRLPDVTAWVEAGADGSPLPPIAGRVVAPTLQVSGATLHGVDVDFDSPGIERGR